MKLIAKYDRQGFGGRANVYDEGRYIELWSYSTRVAFIDKVKRNLVVLGRWSRTTDRHVNEFIRQWGYPGWQEMYMED